MQTGETATTEDGARPAPPPDRYGSPAKKAPKRWKRWVFGAIALVVSFGVAWVGYVNLGETSIDAERVAFEPRPGNAMQITINVTRDDPDKTGLCIVWVQDKSGAESGRKEVLVPAGADHSRVSTVVKSIGPPVTADVFGCSYSIPRYMSTP